MQKQIGGLEVVMAASLPMQAEQCHGHRGTKAHKFIDRRFSPSVLRLKQPLKKCLPRKLLHQQIGNFLKRPFAAKCWHMFAFKHG
jgi:hypothetical protein